jgi:hypothetical protein
VNQIQRFGAQAPAMAWRYVCDAPPSKGVVPHLFGRLREVRGHRQRPDMLLLAGRDRILLSLPW